VEKLLTMVFQHCRFDDNKGGIISSTGVDLVIVECDFRANFAPAGALFDLESSFFQLYETPFERNAGSTILKVSDCGVTLNGTRFDENQPQSALVSIERGSNLTVAGSQFHDNAAFTALFVIDNSALQFALSAVEGTLGVVMHLHKALISLDTAMFTGSPGRTKPVIDIQESSGRINHCWFGDFSYAPAIRNAGTVELVDLSFANPPYVAVDPPWCVNCTYGAPFPDKAEWDFGRLATLAAVGVLVVVIVMKARKYWRLIPRGLRSRKTV
jgi:hypothetical protein